MESCMGNLYLEGLLLIGLLVCLFFLFYKLQDRRLYQQ